MHLVPGCPGVRPVTLKLAPAKSLSVSATVPDVQLLPSFRVLAVNAALDACQTSAPLPIRPTTTAAAIALADRPERVFASFMVCLLSEAVIRVRLLEGAHRPRPADLKQMT